MSWLTGLIIVAIAFFAYRIKWYLGVIVTLLIIAYAIYYYLPNFYRMKGQKCFAEGNYEGARAMYKKAVDTGHAKGDIKMEYSYILLRTGDIDEAEQIVNNILCYKLKPDVRGRAIIQRCMCYYKKGNIDEALSDAKELFDDGFKSIMLYGMIGYFMIEKDPYSQETFDFCAEAYDYADDDRDICDNMLICYYNRAEYKKAKEISDKVLESNPKFVEAWYHGAQIDNKLKDYKSALDKIEKIKECNRSFMTTISEEEIESLKATVESKLRSGV